MEGRRHRNNVTVITHPGISFLHASDTAKSWPVCWVEEADLLQYNMRYVYLPSPFPALTFLSVFFYKKKSVLSATWSENCLIMTTFIVTFGLSILCLIVSAAFETD